MDEKTEGEEAYSVSPSLQAIVKFKLRHCQPRALAPFNLSRLSLTFVSLYLSRLQLWDIEEQEREKKKPHSMLGGRAVFLSMIFPLYGVPFCLVSMRKW